MELTDQEKLIYKGKVCPYCKAPSKYVDSIIIYGRTYGFIYLCEPCKAWVGVHAGTNKALGRLANKKLRELKKEAHSYFDRLWKFKNKIFRRSAAYKWLSQELGLPSEYTHIGMFSEETCKKVIELSKNKLYEHSQSKLYSKREGVVR